MADKNYISYADVDGETIENTVFPAAGTTQSDFSDILKLSHAKNTVVRGCHIYGGKEDCVDMNRNCENILIENCTVYPFGSYGFTIKGGAKNITLRNVIFDGHGREADIDLGNWSINGADHERCTRERTHARWISCQGSSIVGRKADDRRQQR
jgi:pectate lyase